MPRPMRSLPFAAGVDARRRARPPPPPSSWLRPLSSAEVPALSSPARARQLRGARGRLRDARVELLAARRDPREAR